MSIKSLAAEYDKIRDMPIEAALSEEWMEKSQCILRELADNSNLAQKIIFERIPEEEFKKFVLILIDSLVAGMAADGDIALLKAKLSGGLNTFAYSSILATVGALIQDEVL